MEKTKNYKVISKNEQWSKYNINNDNIIEVNDDIFIKKLNCNEVYLKGEYNSLFGIVYKNIDKLIIVDIDIKSMKRVSNSLISLTNAKLIQDNVLYLILTEYGLGDTGKDIWKHSIKLENVLA